MRGGNDSYNDRQVAKRADALGGRACSRSSRPNPRRHHPGGGGGRRGAVRPPHPLGGRRRGRPARHRVPPGGGASRAGARSRTSPGNLQGGSAPLPIPPPNRVARAKPALRAERSDVRVCHCVLHLDGTSRQRVAYAVMSTCCAPALSAVRHNSGRAARVRRRQCWCADLRSEFGDDFLAGVPAEPGYVPAVIGACGCASLRRQGRQSPAAPLPVPDDRPAKEGTRSAAP